MRCIKVPGQVLLSASVSSILNDKSCLCDFRLATFFFGRGLGAKVGVNENLLVEESITSTG